MNLEIFVLTIGQGSKTQIAPRIKWWLIKQPEGCIITTLQLKGCIMTLMQQWQDLNLTRNSFYILFPAKGIMSYRHVISSHF